MEVAADSYAFLNAPRLAPPPPLQLIGSASEYERGLNARLWWGTRPYSPSPMRTPRTKGCLQVR